MITDVLIILLQGFLGIIQFLLGAITYIIPTQIGQAFNTFFAYVQIGNGLFPVTTALTAIGTVLTVWVLLYVVKVILFAFSAIPWFGKVLHLPNHSDNTTVTQSGSSTTENSMGLSTRNWNTTTQKKRSDK